METIDSVSVTILFGAVLVLAGIMSSLVALRFGAPVAAGLPSGRHAGGRIRPWWRQVRRRAAGLHGGLGGARPDPVRRRLAHQICHLPQCAGPGRDARHRGRADHRGADRARRRLGARAQLDRGLAGRRGDGLDRRRGRVLPVARQGPAASPARQRHPGGRIRHQRSVRDLPDHRPGGNPALRPQGLDRHRLLPRSGGGRGRCLRLARRSLRWCRCSTGWNCRRACTGRSSRPARWSLSVLPRCCTARASSRSISPASWWATARPVRTAPLSPSSMLRPGSRRSPCSFCSACSPGRTGCRSGCCRRSPWRWC